MAKYYFTQLASRPLVLSGKPYRFVICSQMAGRSTGVYKAETEEDIQVLDDAVRQRRGVSEIPEEDYENLFKRATLTLQSPKSAGFRPRLALPPVQQPALAMADKAGVVGVGSVVKNEEENLIPAPNPAALIKIARVNSPKPFSGSDLKVERAIQRADRAKVRVGRPSVDSSPSP